MRIRYSLRTLLVATGVFAITVWLGTIAWSYFQAWQAQKYLESRNYLRGYWEDRNDWAVEICDATPTDWQQLSRLGKLWEIGAWTPDCQTAEYRELVRQNESSLRTLILIECELSPELATAVGHARQLTTLKFRYIENDPMEFNHSKQFSIAPLPQLSVIRIWSGSVSDENLAWIAHQPAVTEVEIANNKAVTDATVDTLASCKSLRILSLHRSNISTAGMRKLLAELHLTDITFPAVELDESDMIALVNSELKRINLRDVALSAPVLPLVQCERIENLHISLSHYESLIASGIPFARKNKLRLFVHGLDSEGDIPTNPWPDIVELNRYSRDGVYFGEARALPVMVVP